MADANSSKSKKGRRGSFRSISKIFSMKNKQNKQSQSNSRIDSIANNNEKPQPIAIGHGSGKERCQSDKKKKGGSKWNLLKAFRSKKKSADAHSQDILPTAANSEAAPTNQNRDHDYQFGNEDPNRSNELSSLDFSAAPSRNSIRDRMQNLANAGGSPGVPGPNLFFNQELRNRITARRDEIEDSVRIHESIHSGK